MSKLCVRNLAISLDGYTSAPNQSLENPIGVGGSRLHEWVFATRFGCQMIGKEGGDEGLDNEFLQKGDANIGATIMGRNMFGPIRGSWGDDSWDGWWGPNPPYHHPVFVLTNHPHAPMEMEGGTTFYFVTDGIEKALEQARTAADGKDVRIGGGASTVRQYFRAGLIDELHIAIVPILLGGGEQPFENLGEIANQYKSVEMVSSPAVTHVTLSKSN